MRTLDIIRRVFRNRIARTSWTWRSDFTCGDCERREQCSLPPHDDCVHRAEQIARGAAPIRRWYLPVY
jgi:hypothetical protein